MVKSVFLTIDDEVKARFPDLHVLTLRLNEVKVEERRDDLMRFGEEIINGVRKKYDLRQLKDLPSVRAYRDFFWRVGVDPTKSRPASEALIRRVLSGKKIPNINTLVDAYNLTSMKTEIALAAFDVNGLKGDLIMRFARERENFLGIGMKTTVSLEGGEIVISDREKLIAIYPYRDAEKTKITKNTKNILLLVCGVPKIDDRRLLEASQVAKEYITKFCDGTADK
jgi:DNA/RNA-binding domain of Phe-tRNA-synthetase-like protein